MIEESNSPWCAPVIVVKNRKGKLRLCVDYRQLNQRTVTDPFPIFRIDELLESIKGAKFLSSVDLAAAYNQLEVAESSRPMTAFAADSKQYQFANGSPFGLKNLPAAWSRVMQNILGRLPFVRFYFDDILIVSKTFEEHTEHLRCLFTTLREAGLHIRASKCEFYMQKVIFVGMLVGDDKIEIDPTVKENLAKMEMPTTIRGLRSFLGMFQHISSNIPGFAEIAQPLRQLANTARAFTKPQENSPVMQAFQTLKQALSSAEVLSIPDPGKRFYAFGDASEAAECVAVYQGDLAMEVKADGIANRPEEYQPQAGGLLLQSVYVEEREELAHLEKGEPLDQTLHCR